MRNYYSVYKAEKMGEDIEKKFAHYGINIAIKEGKAKGDRVILSVKLKGKTRWSQLLAYAKDVQLKLKLPLFQVSKNRFSIFIVASELELQYDNLPEILANPTYAEAAKRMKLPYVVGYDIMGKLVIVDLATLNHLLLGGSSNSGKTVALWCLILSAASYKSANKINFIIIDVGANDLRRFDELPHLSCPVIRDREKAFGALNALIAELERRTELEITNNAEFRMLPKIVCVIDEYPALIPAYGDKQMAKKLAGIVSSLLQRGRHVGIHMVLAAQNPTFHNMKCDLNNITARIAFTCAKSNFSMTILDESGAEHLSGNGDMYFKSPKHDGLQRIQGAYITPRELELAIMDIRRRLLLRRSHNKSKFVITEADLREANTDDGHASKPVTTKHEVDDKLFAKIMMWALGRKKISCNLLKDTFSIGWKRASGFRERLQELGIVGDAYAKLTRDVLPVCLEDLSSETVEFLTRHGYTEDHICEVLNSKPTAQI